MLHTTSTSSTGGHTQRNACPTAVSAPRMETSPATDRNTAGAAAQRCGWSLIRTDKTASNAQPNAKPSSTAPGSTSALAGTSGAAATPTATTSPAAIEPATIQPMVALDGR